MRYITLIVYVLGIIFCGISDAPNDYEVYSNMAVVCEIDQESDLVACVDNDGEIWEFYSDDEFHIDDMVILVMSDNGTQSIYDDEIIWVFQTDSVGES